MLLYFVFHYLRKQKGADGSEAKNKPKKKIKVVTLLLFTAAGLSLMATRRKERSPPPLHNQHF